LIQRFGEGEKMMKKGIESLRRIIGSDHERTRSGEHLLQEAMSSIETLSPGELGRITGELVGLESEPELNDTVIEVVGVQQNSRMICRILPPQYAPTTREWIRRLLDEGPEQAGLGHRLSVKSGSVLLLRGTQIHIQGLQSAPELIGQRGYIQSYDEDKGRYQVKVKARERLLGLKTVNCGLAIQPNIHILP
jgi:hypothetical protein